MIRHKAIGSGVEDSVSREMKLDLNGRRKLIHHSITPPVGLCSLGAIRRPAAIDAADETLEARIGLLPRAVCVCVFYVLYCMFAGVWYPVPHMFSSRSGTFNGIRIRQGSVKQPQCKVAETASGTRSRATNGPAQKD